MCIKLRTLCTAFTHLVVSWLVCTPQIREFDGSNQVRVILKIYKMVRAAFFLGTQHLKRVEDGQP